MKRLFAGKIVLLVAFFLVPKAHAYEYVTYGYPSYDTTQLYPQQLAGNQVAGFEIYVQKTGILRAVNVGIFGPTSPGHPVVGQVAIYNKAGTIRFFASKKMQFECPCPSVDKELCPLSSVCMFTVPSNKNIVIVPAGTLWLMVLWDDTTALAPASGYLTWSLAAWPFSNGMPKHFFPLSFAKYSEWAGQPLRPPVLSIVVEQPSDPHPGP